MGQTRSEQETVIRWDEEEKVVHVWSASPVTWRKMARLGIQPTKETTTRGEPSGKFYTVPLEGFRWRLKSTRAGNPGNLRKRPPASPDAGNKPSAP
jgi:hypothetical protein